MTKLEVDKILEKWGYSKRTKPKPFPVRYNLIDGVLQEHEEGVLVFYSEHSVALEKVRADSYSSGYSAGGDTYSCRL